MQPQDSVELSLQFTVVIQPSENADLEQVDRNTRSFLTDLRDSDCITDAGFINGDSAPAGAKSPEAVTVGVLSLAVLPAMLPRLVEFLQSWALRWSDYKIKIKRQTGDQSLEVEYSPAKTSPAELEHLLHLVSQAFPHARQRVKQSRDTATT